ncbi:MAG: serine hydrolase [Patescibacteria group bacterium]
MAMFGKRRDEEEYEDDPTSYETSRGRIHDLKPENRKKRVEPPKPWGKRERYIVLTIFLVTIFTSAILALSARDFKLPGLPKFKFDLKNIFSEQIIVVGNKNNKYFEITKTFEDKTKNLSGTYALYVIDLESGYSFGIDENKLMQAASLIKLPVMLYAQDKVDDKKIEAMGKRSDNAVFNELVVKFGKVKLESFIKNLGMIHTSIEDNTTTPKEVGEFFKKFKSEPFMEFMVDTIYEDWLPKGLPEEVKVVHKYGREIHAVNDAGIVYASKPYIVVIMTQGVVEKEADEIFPELSRLVYDGMSK